MPKQQLRIHLQDESESVHREYIPESYLFLEEDIHSIEVTSMLWIPREWYQETGSLLNLGFLFFLKGQRDTSFQLDAFVPFHVRNKVKNFLSATRSKELFSADYGVRLKNKLQMELSLLLPAGNAGTKYVQVVCKKKDVYVFLLSKKEKEFFQEGYCFLKDFADPLLEVLSADSLRMISKSSAGNSRLTMDDLKKKVVKTDSNQIIELQQIPTTLMSSTWMEYRLIASLL